jgi:ribosomal protein S8
MSIRNAEMAQNSLAASTRIQSELLEKITANCVKILKKAGKIADFKVDGKEVAIKFVNPATRQQDESILAGYSRYGQMMLEMQMPQDLQAQKIKIEDLPSMIWEKLGLPKSGQRNDEEIQGIQEQQAQQAQQQQMAAQGGQA